MFTKNLVTKLVWSQPARRISTQYDLCGAVIIHRNPVIAPEPNIIEKTQASLSWKLEELKSLYSDHELRHFQDLERAKRFAKGETLDEKEFESSATLTAQEFVDVCLQEMKQFQPAPRLTEDDMSGNKKSLNRHLDRSLLLVCKTNVGAKPKWLFPFEAHENGETLRQTAERALRKVNGQKLNVRIVGNAPICMYKYKYPKPVAAKLNKVGAKAFFFRAQYLDGEVDIQDKESILDYLWLDREECKSLLMPKYWHSISPSLYIERLKPDTVESVISRIRRLKKTIAEKQTSAN